MQNEKILAYKPFFQYKCHNNEGNTENTAVHLLSLNSMQGTNAHVAVEISPNSQSKNVFSPILQPWKRERHWYLPNIHRVLSFFQFRCAQGKQTCFLQSSIQSLPSLASMKELKFGNMSILPASYGLEVCKISDQSHSILVSLRSILKLSLTKKKVIYSSGSYGKDISCL